MNYFSKIIKGYLIAFFIFFFFTVLITLLVKFTAVPEMHSALYLIIVLSISTLFLGLYMGNLVGKHGLLYASSSSLLYTFLVIFTLICAYSKPLTAQCFDFTYIIPVIVGGVGGILGVNIRK